MGFDVYGIAASSEAGEYFRNNVWWWRPLWGYICETCPDILTQEDMREGTLNGGHVIHQAKARKLHERLTQLIETGAVKRYETERNEELNSLSDETCDLCGGTGKRNDKYVKGDCNGCEGKGRVRPWETHYPFDEENVKEFADFLTDCGGFEIS